MSSVLRVTRLEQHKHETVRGVKERRGRAAHDGGCAEPQGPINTCKTMNGKEGFHNMNTNFYCAKRKQI